MIIFNTDRRQEASVTIVTHTQLPTCLLIDKIVKCVSGFNAAQYTVAERDKQQRMANAFTIPSC
jgi:hypothetical protein